MPFEATREDRFSRAEQVLADWLAKESPSPLAGLLAAHPDLEQELRELGEAMGILDGAIAQGRERLAAERVEIERVLSDLGRGAEFGPRYAVEGEIGKGGMGAVFRVQDKKLGRSLAMKVILGQADASRSGKTPAVAPVQLQRFLNEARITGQLQHPGIVPVHEVGVDGDGRAYFMMKLVQGRTLGELFAKQRSGDPAWPRRRVVALIQRVCEAVAYAHSKGVVHRDLKPGNVMVGDHGEVYVMDWGLARRLDEAADAATESAVDAELSAQVTMTRDGAVLGTPAYMPPEQAAGRVDEIGPPADVYAIGAMLYESIAGHAPYCGPGEDSRGSSVLRRIVAEPPAPLVAPNVPPELLAICAKAMAHDWRQRYATVEELAQELGAFVDRRVVRAYATGARAELVKWVQRNRALASSVAALVLALVAGIGGTWWLAERNAVIAQEKTDLARKEATAKEEASRLAAEKGRLAEEKGHLAEEKGRTVAQFHQLSAVVRLKDAIAKQDALWPAWPDKVAALQECLDKDCAQLLAQRPQIEATIAELGAKALPLTPEQVAADRRSEPTYSAWQQQTHLVASLLRAQAIRNGLTTLSVPALTTDHQAMSGEELLDAAWKRVAPPPAKPDEEWERTVYGEEALGLALAQQAVAQLGSGDRPAVACHVHETLAWALLANGRDGEVQVAADAGIAAVAPERAAHLRAHERDRAAMLAAIAEAPARLAAAQARLADLEIAVSMRRTWNFGTDEESESARFLHHALVDVLAGLSSMAAKERADVVKRLIWAQQVQPASLGHPNARVTWAAAREAIAKADDVVASKLYSGISIPLPDEAVIGLVPIGMNPVTKLWEFYDLGSAWDGEQAAAEIAIPAHREDGSIEVKDETGIVFVLLPGGTVTLGSQNDDPNAPFFDPQRDDDEELHEVSLEPFLLARHELTLGQWQRLGGDRLIAFEEGYRYRGDRTAIGRTHPAVSMDWGAGDRLMTRHGMVLPSEAQWEYGARGGTTTVFWPGQAEADLQGCANVYDKTAFEANPDRGEPPPITDAFIVIAPVASFKPNGFGLYDVHGNVWEWCRDWYGDYGSERVGDGLRSVWDSEKRSDRGGSYHVSASSARSASRGFKPPSALHDYLGLRPARSITE